jgi:hypothetical protein
MDTLGSGAGVLQIDILRRNLHIVHGGFDIGVPHQLHEGRQADTGAHHIGGEGVSEAVRIGEPDPRRAAMMAE